jgi:acyl-CoA thioesterase YciA
VLYIFAVPVVILPGCGLTGKRHTNVPDYPRGSESKMESTGEKDPQTDCLGLPSEAPLIRVTAMPADANPNGDIFGGWLLAHMDLAGGNLAMQRARGRCATVAIDGMVFHEPVFVGDEVSCFGEIIRTGRTSVTIRIEAWRRNLASGMARRVTQATFTYVAIGEDRRPRPLPPDAVRAPAKT